MSDLMRSELKQRLSTPFMRPKRKWPGYAAMLRDESENPGSLLTHQYLYGLVCAFAKRFDPTDEQADALKYLKTHKAAFTVFYSFRRPIFRFDHTWQ